MSPDQRAKAAEAWASVAAVYGRDLSRPSLKIMIDAVEDLPGHKVIEAILAWPRTAKQMRHPYPAEIRELIKPTVSTDALAREAAARIVQAIGKFGWAQPEAARAFIGEIGWQVVKRYNGWGYICENHGVELDPGTFHAQARDLAKTMIELEQAGELGQAPQFPSRDGRLSIGQPQAESKGLTLVDPLALIPKQPEGT